MTFQIESRNTASSLTSEWDIDGIGEPNAFDTYEEAEAAIEELRQLGDDWAAAEYRVVEVADA